MKYSLFNNVLQEASNNFWKQKRQIIRMLQASGLIVRHRKIKNAAILYHAAFAKATKVRSYEELARYMAQNYNVQMYPSAWKKWLDKVAQKLLEFAEKQIKKELKSSTAKAEFAVDATRFTMDGASEVIRVHTLMQLGSGLPTQTYVTDQHGAESTKWIQIQKSSLYLGDRAYGRSPSIGHVADCGGNYVFRISPSQIRLYSNQECTEKIKMSDYLSKEILDITCWHRYQKKAYPLRIVGKMLPPEKQRAAEKRVCRKSNRACTQLQPETILYAKWLLVATSLQDAPAEEILKKYRERWQIELFFKRGKSALKFRKLPYSKGQYRTTEITLWLFAVKLCALGVFRFMQTHSGDFSLYKLFCLARDCLA